MTDDIMLFAVAAAAAAATADNRSTNGTTQQNVAKKLLGRIACTRCGQQTIATDDFVDMAPELSFDVESFCRLRFSAAMSRRTFSNRCTQR